jgi:undecaprenyl pyrophosphate phosphatase UppP
MLEALFLGIVQGLTEFLPISSSAHIRIVGVFMTNANDPGAAFTAITQIGTELAVLIYFRKDILQIARAWLKRDGSAEARLSLSSVPFQSLCLAISVRITSPITSVRCGLSQACLSSLD